MTTKELQYYYIEECKKWVQKEEQRLNRKLKACVHTLGCQMNSRDSEKLLGILEAIGYVESEEQDADFVIYNTCTVRENANLKVYGRLGILQKMKEKNPNLIVGLCGCMMQEEQVVEKIKKSYRFVDLIFGTHNIFMLAEILHERINSKKMVVKIQKAPTEIVEELPVERKFPFKSGVNITFGCDNFCTYCIVPYVRGRERSRKPEDIIKEVEALAKDGVVEIMLLGQNVNSYGKNLEKPVNFAMLLEMLEKVEGIERIRFMTPHPKDFSDDVIDVISKSEKITRQIHLPFQSGSSRILKLMNRNYTKEDYLNLIEKIRAKVKDASFSTDIIVGFPGETKEDFLETLDVVKKVRFDSAFTFIYSKRTGTKAALMEDNTTKEEIKERFDILLKEIKSISSEITKQKEGSIEKILVEEVNEHDNKMITGRLTNSTLVHAIGDKSLIGKIVKVRLDEAKGFYYMGTIV